MEGLKKVNWFGKTYYGLKKEYRRSIRGAMELWFSEHVLGIRYTPDGKGNLEKNYFYQMKKLWESLKK